MEMWNLHGGYSDIRW
uniref:Kinesin-like protein n=1 Tax=Rhizophora mucronata TaxID=61149 RepID=A0A2P2J4P0_RHIMU